MATLDGAITELIGVISGVSGIQVAPTSPAEQVTAYPAAFAYATSGRSRNAPAGSTTDLHAVQIAVLMPLNDMGQATQTMLPLYEPMIAALINYRDNRTSSNFQTFGDITYTLGPIDWGGVVMYGYVLTLEEVKIQNVI